MRFRAAVLLIAATFFGKAAAYQFDQCANVLIITNLFTGLINAITTFFSPYDSYTGCANHCQNDVGAMYSLYQPGLAGLFGTCYCTNTNPTAGFVTAGSNSGGSCPVATYQINYMGPGSNVLNFAGCSTGTSLTNPTAPIVTNDISQCFIACQSRARMLVTPAASGNTFTCMCGDATTGGSSATCNRNVGQVYNNQIVSVAARRRRRELAERLRRENDTPCPRGYDACLLPGSAHAYECLDTLSELEACGGCTNGYFDDGKNRTAMGLDCNALPGVALGGATCRRGECVVTRCRWGWDFKDGECVPKLNRQS